MVEAKVDVIYALGVGSRWENNELRYSLRSIEKHGKNIGKVFVTGERPDFISDEVVFTSCNDDYSYGGVNTNEKILHTLRNNEVSDNFVFMNDDFFLNRDVDLSQYPYYYKRMLSPDEDRKKYGRSLVYTYYYLVFKEKEHKNFEVHCPILFNKNKFMELNDEWTLCKKLPLGLQTRSIYCNMHGIKGIKSGDCKIRRFDAVDEVRKIIEPRDCFSIADAAIESGMDRVLSEMFSEKSKYEK